MTDGDHLALTHRAALALDERIRGWDHRAIRAEVGSVADLVRMLRDHGDYWDRVQRGRLQKVKRAMARLMQPFFRPQVQYNLVVAEHLGRIEVALDDLRRRVDRLTDESSQTV